MKAYILDTGARVAPMGDAVSETPVLNRRLAEYQREELRPFVTDVEVVGSVDQIRDAEFLLVEDSFFFTRHFVRRALATLRKHPLGGAPMRFSLGESRYLREKAVLGGLTVSEPAGAGAFAELPMVVWRGEPFRAERLSELPRCEVAIDERTYSPQNFNLLPEGEKLVYSITREGVLSIRHWSHILDVNQVAMCAYWFDLSPARVAWYIWRAATALSFTKWGILRNINVVGRGCDIHPTAFVAGSVLGDGVTIGPHSTVFASFLGNGSSVEGLSDVAATVLGERASISFRTKVNLSVLYPQSLASYPAMQMSVLGRRAQHLGGCFPIDMKLTRESLLDVRVKHDGRVVDSGKKCLGICVGHRSIVGTGLWFNSGVEVPNDYVIVRDRDDIVTKIPDGYAGETLSLQDGALRRYDRRG